MHFLEWILDTLRDPRGLIEAGGYYALGLVIFLETGAMVFFLPGDSLLFVAGMYAAKGVLNIFMLNALLIPLAILGDATSYFIGARTGPRLFNKPETRFFKPQYIKQAHDFYEKHGGKAIVLARFVPIVRTFVPVVAGVAGMRYRDFALYNVFGAAFFLHHLKNQDLAAAAKFANAAAARRLGETGSSKLYEQLAGIAIAQGDAGTEKSG